MKTKEEIQKEFVARFDALLLEFGAEFECKDYWEGYSEAGQDVRATVLIDGQYTKDGDCYAESCEIDLGNFRNPRLNKA